MEPRDQRLRLLPAVDAAALDLQIALADAAPRVHCLRRHRADGAPLLLELSLLDRTLVRARTPLSIPGVRALDASPWSLARRFAYAAATFGPVGIGRPGRWDPAGTADRELARSDTQ